MESQGTQSVIERERLISSIRFAAMNDMTITAKPNSLPRVNYPFYFDADAALNMGLQTLLGLRKQVAISIVFGKPYEPEVLEIQMQLFQRYNESIKQLIGL